MTWRNFTLQEIVHTPLDQFPSELLPIAYMALGYAQALRDYLQVPININSGYRSKEYNATLPGSAADSFHIWRYENGKPIWALDISSPSMSAAELYEKVRKFVVGETYLHRRFQFVHISPTQKQDEEWTQ